MKSKFEKHSNQLGTTEENSNDYLNASLPSNLGISQPLPSASNRSNYVLEAAKTENAYEQMPISNIELHDISENAISVPSVPVQNENNVDDLRISVVSQASEVGHEYVDMNYDELVSQRQNEHCYTKI